jgi:hypothetical protein
MTFFSNWCIFFVELIDFYCRTLSLVIKVDKLDNDLQIVPWLNILLVRWIKVVIHVAKHIIISCDHLIMISCYLLRAVDIVIVELRIVFAQEPPEHFSLLFVER